MCICIDFVSINIDSLRGKVNPAIVLWVESIPYDDPGFAEELGRTIRLLRIDRDVERRELAEQVGISYSYLSAIENGTKTPSARLLYSLARAFGVRDDELLAMARERMEPRRGAGIAPVPPPAPLAAAAPPASEPRRRLRRRRSEAGADAEELAKLLGQLDPDDAAAVLDLARRLAGKQG